MKLFFLRAGLILFVMMSLLTGCGKQPATQSKTEVSLLPEERAALTRQVEQLTREIDQYQPLEDDDSLYAPVALFVDLARAYRDMGEIGAAIQVYKKGLRLHKRSQVMVHNLGRLYEHAREYERAARQYQILIDDYAAQNYYYDLAWAHIRDGQYEPAREAYDTWRQKQNKEPDLQTEQALTKLKSQ